MGWLEAIMGSFDAARAASAEALFAASELAVAVPAALLSSLPFLDRLRWRPGSFIALACILLLALLATAPVLAGFGAPTNNVLLPALALFFAAYVHAFEAPLAKKAAVFLSCAMISAFVTYAAIIADTFLGGSSCYLSWPGLTAQWVLCLVVVALLARPMMRQLPAILDTPIAGRRFWGSFWILPLAMTCALVVLVPDDTSTLLYRRVGLAAVVGVGSLFALTVLAYALLLRLAIQATSVLATQRREMALSMRLLMQGHLEERMEDARRARHDQRQHDRTIRGFLEARDLEGLAAYLDAHEAHAAELSPLRVCDNPAVNAVAVYYWDAALHAGAEVQMRLELPRHSGFDDDELVVLLGNLLENAVEALERLDAGGESERGRLDVRAWRDAQGALFVHVSNSCDAAPAITPDGIASTKHAGPGLGTASVRTIAEAHAGWARFACKDGAFTADVMLGA